MFSRVSRLLMCAVGVVLLGSFWVDAAQAQCTGQERLRVTCEDDDDDALRIRIKKGEPGAELTVRVTGDDGFEEEFKVTLNDRGAAKLRVDVDDGDDDGRFTVTIVGCNVSKRVKCDD